MSTFLLYSIRSLPQRSQLLHAADNDPILTDDGDDDCDNDRKIVTRRLTRDTCSRPLAERTVRVCECVRGLTARVELDGALGVASRV